MNLIQGDKVYTINAAEHVILISDAKDLSIRKIFLSPLLYPLKVLADEKNGYIYIYNQGRVMEITILDMSGRIIRSIPISHPLSDFQFLPETETLYAASQAGGFEMVLKNNGNPVFSNKEQKKMEKPEIFKTKINGLNLLRVSPLSGRLYVLNDFANNYLSFEPRKLDKLGELDLGSGPYSIFFANDEFFKDIATYIINSGINEIWKIHTSDIGVISITKKIKADKRIYFGAGLNGVKKANIASDGSIIVLDTQKDQIIKTIDIQGKLSIIGKDKEEKSLFIAINNDTIGLLDGNSDIIKAKIFIGRIQKAVFDSIDSKIYILSSNKLAVINDRCNKIGEVVLTGSIQNIAVAPWLKKIYLLNPKDDKLLVFDFSLREIDSVDLEDFCLNIGNATIYPDKKTNKVYLACPSDRIAVIDPIKNIIVKTIPLPVNPNPVLLETDPDNGRLYVSNKWGDGISVFDSENYKFLALINNKGETQWLN